MAHHRHLSILYTDLQEDLGSSEQGKGHEKGGVNRWYHWYGGTKSLNPSGMMNTFRLGSMKIVETPSRYLVFTGYKKELMLGE